SSCVLCVGCGAQLYGFSPCQWCTCERCGNDLLNGFCSLCKSGNSYAYDPNLNSFDCPPDSYHPPHPTYETYSYDSYGNNSQFGYDCQPQFPLNYESEPGYIENYNSYPYDSSSLPQQYPCCTRCEGPHMNFQCQLMNQDFYNSNSLDFDQPQPPQSPVIHQPPQELSIPEMEDLKQQYLDELKRLSNLEYHDENKIAELTENFNWDEHLDTIPAMKSNKVIKSSVEDLIPIPSESEGIPEHMCDVPFLDNSPPLDVSKDQIEDFFDSNNEFSSIDDDSFSFDKIDYVEASPLDSKLVNLEVIEIVIPKVGGIDADILLKIKDDILRENLLNVNHLFAKIEASNDNPIPFYDPIISGTPSNLTPSRESDFFLEFESFLAVEDEPTSPQLPKSYLDLEGDMLLLEAFLYDDHSFDFKTKSSTTSLNSLLEETNNFDNSLPEFTTFSNVLFDAEYESNSSDDQSCSDEDHPDNAESDLMEFLHTHNSSLPISSKIDSLLDEFAGELTILKSIPLRIDETDCDFEEDIHLIEKFLYDNSSPRPPEEFVSVNSDAKIKSFSLSHILVKDSDSLMEEIDLTCTSDYPMPSGIEEEDYDSERDILTRKDLPSNNTLSFAEKESFHFDIPLFSCPPAKPPDDSIDQTDLANLDNLFVDPTPEMFTDEHAPDYSLPSRFDVYPDDFLEIESDADNFDDDPFDSKGEKIKESELLIDQLDLPCDILCYLEYDSFASQDFSRDDD
nr:hypothetical protein [Tanacetum cinerariifolium]